MADYSPDWDAIASAWQDELSQLPGIRHVYYPYPENAVDMLELPCVIINEPQQTTSSGFTHGAISVTYTGEISLLVKAVDTGQARLLRQDIKEIEAFTLSFFVAVHQIRRLENFASHISLGAATTARLSPYDPDNRGNYAGKVIPYTVTMQYRSRP